MCCVSTEESEYTSAYKQTKDEFSSMFTQCSKMFISQSQNQQWATLSEGGQSLNWGEKIQNNIKKTPPNQNKKSGAV